jgi:glycosyltransferase involved in cell wall biosynthesis
MYGSVAIERDPGWNVAYWNLNHRHVAQSDGTFSVNGQPLLFFHFSGFAPGARILSKHQNRFTIEGVPPAVRALMEEYATDLQRAGAEECQRIPYAFGRLFGGDPIPELARRCYREDFPLDTPHPDLWTVDGQAFLLDWLNQPRPEHRGAPWLTRIAATFYRTRPDLQAAFPDVTGVHGLGYAYWFVENAEAQAGFSEIFTAPVRSALEIGRGRGRWVRKPQGRVDRAQPVAWAEPTAAGAMVAAPGAAVLMPIATPRQAIARRIFQVAYRAAWGIRHAVKPLTTQAFRHRVRHSLLRKAYFDDRYQIPPLAPIAAALTAEPADPLRGAIPSERARESAQRAQAESRLAVTEGVNVVGYLAAESGVGESARSTLRILSAARIQMTPIDFRVGNMSRMSEAIPDLAMGGVIRSINLFHVNGDQMALARENLGTAFFDGRYNIGYWAWELPEFPDAWMPALDLLDEVWVPSAFCQQAIAAKSPVPVLRVPHAVEAPSVAPDRAAFGIGEGDVAFFAMCDVLSVPERKNPFGAAEAFRRAFPGNEAVRLLLKISNLEHQPDLRWQLQRLVATDPRIILLEGYLARQQLWTLMASVDCFVSLHRSEGFGLGMAEAMACGRALIATGWSGNVDFTRPDNALLVEYNLVELERDLGPYRRGQVWAEPDLDAAAHCMRQIASSADLRQRLGARARQTVARELSPAAIAPMVRTRLEAIAEWR